MERDMFMTKKLNQCKDAIGINMVIKGMLLLLLILLPVTGQALETGDRAPDFHVTTKGKAISYDRDLKDRKPVYLIFWTTW